MSDDSVRAALRSDLPLVVVEAPAGCGKTHQGADYAREVAAGSSLNRLLILTHTHAACSMFAERTREVGPSIEIRTIDSIIASIASAYHAGLGLPADTAAWIRARGENGYADLAVKVALLLTRHPMIAASLVKRHPIVICDEHQDSSGDQHALAMALLNQNARLRVFGDPMQRIFRDKTVAGSQPAYDWTELTQQAQAFEKLDQPHRWRTGCPELGRWTLRAREALAGSGTIDLRTGLPPSVSVAYAENQSHKNLDYRLLREERPPIDTFERAQSSLLILTRYPATARSFRGVFNRRIPLWEGHTRPALETLVDAIDVSRGDPGAVAGAVVRFLGNVGRGFSPSAFGDAFEQEAREGCTKKRAGKPAAIQELARFLVDQPDHRGIARMLRRLSELIATSSTFADVEIDCHKEFWDAIRLGEFETAHVGLAEITHRRTQSHPKPPPRAISTIYKAKGLECESVIVMPCDAKTFPNNLNARCLLYVALSRAKSRLLLVVSPSKPSPLFIL